MILRHYMVVPEGVLELICDNSSTMAYGGDCDTLHSQGNHDKMPIQLGRTRGEVYHTFCVLILKSPLTYALVQRRRVISSCSPQFLGNLKTLKLSLHQNLPGQVQRLLRSRKEGCRTSSVCALYSTLTLTSIGCDFSLPPSVT